MNKRVLITGGAGFLGSHLADALLAHNYQVRVLDVLSPQVHGVRQERPTYLPAEVELVCGDVCHTDVVRQALHGVSAVFHFAAAYNQERICLMIGRAYNIPTEALRFFNVFGPRQALSNPYTGVLAIFASRYLHDQPPMIFEDGLQQRDFVSVYDVVQACRLALEVPPAAVQVFNLGSGCASTISEVAALMAQVLGKTHLEPCITQKYSMGDIRHCFADITRAQAVLGYTPRVLLAAGLEEMVEWLTGQIADDYSPRANAEMIKRGLMVSTTSI